MAQRRASPIFKTGGHLVGISLVIGLRWPHSAFSIDVPPSAGQQFAEILRKSMAFVSGMAWTNQSDRSVWLAWVRVRPRVRRVAMQREQQCKSSGRLYKASDSRRERSGLTAITCRQVARLRPGLVSSVDIMSLRRAGSLTGQIIRAGS